MDMSSSGSNSTSSSMMSSMMVPWLHTAGGDNLLFSGVAPSSKGAIAGATFFLFFLSILDRFVSASHGVMEARWRKRLSAALLDKGCEEHDSLVKGKAGNPHIRRTIPPFIPSIDISRGAFKVVQSVLHYTLMLAVMIFQVAYIIGVVAGLGVGELLFGRFPVAAGLTA